MLCTVAGKRGITSTPTRLVAREIDQEDDDEQDNEYARGGCDDLDDEDTLFMPEVVGKAPNGGAESFDEQLDQLEVRFFLYSPQAATSLCSFYCPKRLVRDFFIAQKRKICATSIAQSDEFAQALQALCLVRTRIFHNARACM